MESSNLDIVINDKNVYPKLLLEPSYSNNLEFIGSHLHTPCKTELCNVCDVLSKISEDDIISAGAKQQRPIRLRNRPKADPCKSNSDNDKQKSTVVNIDEITSTHDWQYNLRKDGNAIVKYLIDKKCDIRNFTMQDLINVMKTLNIIRSERQELFELLAHVKGSLSSNSVSVKMSHPLMAIYSHSDNKIGDQLKILETTYSPSRYQALIDTTRFQSTNFVDMSTSSDILFKFKDQDSIGYVHPILVALFGVKLPALENAMVLGDSYSLMKQLYNSKRVKPENYMLLINRLTEDNPIIFTGVNDSISSEIHRASIHTMIRKVILNLRLGIFYCKDNDLVDNYLMKIIHIDSSQMMADEEQILASILSIVGFRPALVSVTDPYQSLNVVLKPVSYIVVSPSKMITTMNNPISINSSSIYSLSFDNTTGRVMFMPANMRYQGTISCRTVDALPVLNSIAAQDRAVNSPVIVNGTLIYYIERRQNKNIISGECYTGFRSVISDKPMDIASELSINGITYMLKSAVCYKTHDFLTTMTGNCDGGDIFLKGYYTILFTEMGPWMYDPLSIYSKHSRESRMMRVMKSQYYKEHQNDDGMFYEWMKEESTKKLCDIKQQQLMNHTVMFEDDLISHEEAMNLISRNCCILIYAQDYIPYLATKNISDIFV
ncbi:SWPV1-213 [Shearwaterpox virus]|uniref:Virion core protein 4b n=2 Tax=Canarypox virus TaxID=44088 RepID=A0A1V0QGY3_CNPV|nr:SWPV1-213 [Shearwaterpox virus]